MSTPAFQVKKKQRLYAGIAGVMGLTFVGVLLWSLEREVKPSEPSFPLQETKLITAGQRINPQEVWVERIASENKLTQEKLDTLEKLLTAHIKGTADSEERVQHEIEEIKRNKSEETVSSLSTQILQDTPGASQDMSPGASRDMSQGSPNAQRSAIASGIHKKVLNLSGVNPGLNPGVNQGVKSGDQAVARAAPETTLPAGAFVKAILLGGVDASTSISAPSDPRPVLLRVTDHGNLPRKFKSDLKDCHLLASCYGDLSSERVYMRLETLTCTERLTGEISETQVAGYVVGEDGKAGVRGVVADKAGPLVRNSLVGGFLSGMGQFFSAQQHAISPMAPFGQMHALTPQHLLSTGVSGLSAGAATGVSNALEKMSDFFIRRAEQLQPVLQVAAGREVDIVFTQGTQFGETRVRKSLSKIRNQSRKQAIQKLERHSQPDTQSWLPEITPESGGPQGEPFQGEPSQNPPPGDDPGDDLGDDLGDDPGDDPGDQSGDQSGEKP